MVKKSVSEAYSVKNLSAVAPTLIGLEVEELLQSDSNNIAFAALDSNIKRSG